MKSNITLCMNYPYILFKILSYFFLLLYACISIAFGSYAKKPHTGNQYKEPKFNTHEYYNIKILGITYGTNNTPFQDINTRTALRKLMYTICYSWDTPKRQQENTHKITYIYSKDNILTGQALHGPSYCTFIALDGKQFEYNMDNNW